MSDTSLTKKKLLQIASSGKFVNFTPEQLSDLYEEVKEFLIVNHSQFDSSIELFNIYELQFYLSVLTLHDIEAKNVLDKITDQFESKSKDVSSQRVKLLKSIYYESQGDANNQSKLLTEDPNELQLSRRLVTMSKSRDTPGKYINNLIYYLNLQPSDLQTWNELSEEYKKLGEYKKAIFCLKEIVLQDPLNYLIFYKIGLLNYYLFLQTDDTSSPKKDKKDKLLELMNILINARDNYLYSIEINDKFVKSWVGLKALVDLTFFYDKLVKINQSSKEIQQFLDTNDKLKPIIEKKFIELDIKL
ncbi:oca3 TPR repeat protein oca3 [Candida maltosa Xu316]|uniref:ER membrane protein complex subunit 2 n=1 Tax=Candida maltosa (strain Xu316) TaxID=1245528 RepID=M3JY95_CANMX|nr:hypothetical protein G210_1582 [Candida maltosa Xu316]